MDVIDVDEDMTSAEMLDSLDITPGWPPVNDSGLLEINIVSQLCILHVSVEDLIVRIHFVSGGEKWSRSDIRRRM